MFDIRPNNDTNNKLEELYKQRDKITMQIIALEREKYETPPEGYKGYVTDRINDVRFKEGEK